MNKLSRFLIKMIFIILIMILLVMLFKLTGLRVTLLMFFFVFVGKTWNYGSFKSDINSQFEDYYSLFNLKQDFNKDELQGAYDNEIDKLNNNLSISIDNRLHLMSMLNTAFDTLNDPLLKSEYDITYNSLLDEIKKEEANMELQNQKFSTFVKGLLNYNIKPFQNYVFFSKNTIGILACLIIDLVFIIPLLLKN